MNKEPLAHSELILNEDSSIYHLHLKPGDIAQTIITVGDPDRVEAVTKHFDSIEVNIQRREFKTQTGLYKGKRLTVISTGIGTDNIDIVFNELDALVNIDFNTRTVKDTHTQLEFIRIGTSGAIQNNIPIDSFLVSEIAIGLDSLLQFYKSDAVLDRSISEAFEKYCSLNQAHSTPYAVHSNKSLHDLFAVENEFVSGVTVTNVGFYGPQNRSLRLKVNDPSLASSLQSFVFDTNEKQHRITNLEMETSGIYGMAKLLGHKAISLNAILANRATGDFSQNPKATIDKLIKKTLDLLTQ